LNVGDACRSDSRQAAQQARKEKNMSGPTDAELLDTAVTLACERHSAPMREEVDHLVEHLLDRSREHERRLAQIDERLEESTEHLAERLRPHERQLTELCDKWAFVSETLARQGREIERLNAAVEAIERTAASNRARAGRSRRGLKISSRLSRSLYWLCCAVAFASLAGGVWLMADLLDAAPVNAQASFVPLGLIGLSVVAGLSALALGRMLARRRSDADRVEAA
jgi:hypothetical protein